jgi:Uncharacterized protein conserved in bacteria
VATKNNNSQSADSQETAKDFRLFGHPISKRILYTVLAVLLLAGALYATVIHPHVVQFWYAQQELPVFKVDSRYLSRYSGRAQLRLSNGSLLYEGEFLNGNYSGEGALYSETGALLYSGMFENNLYHGAGTLHYTEGDAAYTYSGAFSKGVKSGSGQLLRGGALLYEGEFADGLYNGIGTEYDPETGNKVFQGQYLAGKRTAGGITYDDSDDTPVIVPAILDPTSLLGMSYADTYAALVSGGTICRSISSLDGMLLLIDDANSVVYAFAADKDTAKPQFLAKVYLCNLSAVAGIIVGTDTDLVKRTVYATAAPGTLSGAEDAFALALSNRYWNRSVEIAGIGSISYLVENKLVTAYYPPDTFPQTEPVQVGIDDDGNPIMELPDPQPMRQGGLILFLKVEPRSDGDIK